MLQNYPDSIVLACAPSNSAADLILERVAQHQVVPKAQMVRLNAFGRHQSSVNKNVLVWGSSFINAIRILKNTVKTILKKYKLLREQFNWYSLCIFLGILHRRWRWFFPSSPKRTHWTQLQICCHYFDNRWEVVCIIETFNFKRQYVAYSWDEKCSKPEIVLVFLSKLLCFSFIL